MIISAIGVVFAYRAASASRETVRLTRRIKWEAELRSVLEPVVAIRRAAEDYQPTGGPGIGPGEALLRDRLWEAKQALDSAVVLPWWFVNVTDNDAAVAAVERLRTMRIPAGQQPDVVAQIGQDAAKMERLLTTRAPSQSAPKWYLRLLSSYVRLVSYPARRHERKRTSD